MIKFPKNHSLIYSVFFLLWSIDKRLSLVSSSLSQCDYCMITVNDFQSAWIKTENENFGGGNTDWEENNLGSYHLSESRLVQIIEKLCIENKLSGDERTKCFSFVESSENFFEEWWFKNYSRNYNFFKNNSISLKDSLYEFVCVNSQSICCMNGYFGPNCSPCDGLDLSTRLLKICSDHGTCEGNMTRVGSGLCKCDNGYEGSNCSTCSTGFYIENSTEFACLKCDISCDVNNGCTGPGNEKCFVCAPGYHVVSDTSVDVQEFPITCVDIDECLNQNAVCQNSTYCLNTQGAFECKQCDSSCAVCNGPSSDACLTCKEPEYQFNSENRCERIEVESVKNELLDSNVNLTNSHSIDENDHPEELNENDSNDSKTEL